MPKETVYGEQMAYDPADPKPRVARVEVMWNREAGHVQIVSKATDAEGGRWAGYPKADEPYDETNEHHVTDGYYVNLGRVEINTLIRHLRRARDQAFGRDE